MLHFLTNDHGELTLLLNFVQAFGPLVVGYFRRLVL